VDELRGYPRTSFERYRELYGNDFVRFLDTMDMKPRQSIRVNTLKTDPESLESSLTEKGFELRRVDGGACFLVDGGPFPLSSTVEFLQGMFYIQGLAEAAIVPQLGCLPEETNWDMCAAPGGKTTQMAEHMENAGAILATDVSMDKLRALKNNLARMGVVNTIVLRQDARKIRSKARFDKILLDAPCTGSGIIRKDPSRKDSRSLQDVTFMSSIQKGLLQRAAAMLKSSGEMVYSTCSLEPEENEMLVDWAIKNLPLEPQSPRKGFLEISPGFTSPLGKKLDSSVGKCGRIHPHVNDTNGMFFAILRKT